MSTVDIAALQVLLADATQGEWFQEPHTAAGRVWVAIGRKWWPKARLEPIFEVRNEDTYEQREKDAALVVALVNAAPALLDENEQLRTSVNRQFGEPLDEVYKTDGITIVMDQIHDLRKTVASALAIHKPSTLTEDVWYEDCDRDGCDTSKGCNGHETVVCDHEECWAIGVDGDALPNPWPCATARALGVQA